MALHRLMGEKMKVNFYLYSANSQHLVTFRASLGRNLNKIKGRRNHSLIGFFSIQAEIVKVTFRMRSHSTQKHFQAPSR